MNILVCGATGFIGQRLVERLLEDGHTVWAISRRPDQATRLLGVPALADVGSLPKELRIDAVINLAGQPLPGRRWTAAYKQLLRDSRIALTEQLQQALLDAGQRPAVWINGSAIGYYGDRGQTPLDEHAAPGDDFAAQLCQDWEAVAMRAEGLFGARVCLLRTGLVLGPGGALSAMLPPFRLGLGGPMGNGQQIMSWIHREDLVSLLMLLLNHGDARGAFNGTSPAPVCNRDFAAALGRVLHRPAFLPLPAPVLKLALGEMAKLLLGGQHVLPKAALALDYRFRFTDVEHALRQVLGVKDSE